MKRFPGYYRDINGSESVVFALEGSAYAVTIRGVRFTARQPEDFEPEEGTPEERLSTFSLATNSLVACAYGFHVPLILVCPDHTEEVILSVAFCLEATHTLTVRLLSPSLDLSAQDDKDTYFDAALERLLAQLPLQTHLRFCFGCRWGAIEPCYGLNGNFGCFRTRKAEREAAQSHKALMHLWPPPEHRQEIDCCEEFTPHGN